MLLSEAEESIGAVQCVASHSVVLKLVQESHMDGSVKRFGKNQKKYNYFVLLLDNR